jgi:hypothetical protein
VKAQQPINQLPRGQPVVPVSESSTTNQSVATWPAVVLPVSESSTINQSKCFLLYLTFSDISRTTSIPKLL